MCRFTVTCTYILYHKPCQTVSHLLLLHVCVFFQSDAPLCLQCTYTLPCFSIFVCFCSLPSIYCAAHVPHSSAIFLWSRYLTTMTLSDTDSWTSSNRNIKDATRTTLRYTFGMNGIPTVISESSPAQ